ncbi:EamA family transporter [Labrys okinawensis]|uniref:EamA family transporter n=1 Tax=Labrys okinawensis TaxID=346911 RepID=UPI0039BD379D
MTMLAILVLAGTICCDVIGQLCFKVGLDDPSISIQARPIWLRVIGSPLIWLGLATYAVEIAAWLFVLSRLPLSVAFPLAGLSYCGIALASRFILRESISRRRWIGTILIALGAAVVGSSL